MQSVPFPTNLQLNGNSPAINSRLAGLRQQITRENQQLMSNEMGKMTKVNEQLGNIIAQVETNRVKCEQTIANLNREIRQLDEKVTDYQKSSNSSAAEDKYRGQIKGFQDQYVNICKDRVRIANQINVKNLKKIHIDDKKSPANQVFKWVLSTIYNQPDNKYFWPNFKQEALENDKGKDFIQRIGKVSSLNAKQDNRFRTQQFLQNYGTISAAPELQKYKGEVDKIYQIAKCYKRGYMISNFIKQHEDNIKKHKQSTMEKDQQFMRWKAKSQALKDRIQINQTYLKTLTDIGTKLVPKRQLYSEKLQSGQSMLNDFQGFQKLQRWTPSISPSINLNHQPKGNCECESCSIF